jgi:hypothetical protein
MALTQKGEYSFTLSSGKKRKPRRAIIVAVQEIRVKSVIVSIRELLMTLEYYAIF